MDTIRSVYEIVEIGKGGFATVYSAIWKNVPLYLESQDGKYKRDSNKKIALKCLDNSQNVTNKLLNEIWNLLQIFLK